MTLQPANESQTWASIAHLSALAGMIVPFGNFFGPLAVWLWKRRLSPQVDDQGKEALNFQISLFAYFWGILLVLGGPALLLGILGGVKAGQALPSGDGLSLALLMAVALGALLLVVLFSLAAVGIVFPIIAAVRANGGENYRYPLAFRLVK